MCRQSDALRELACASGRLSAACLKRLESAARRGGIDIPPVERPGTGAPGR